MSKLWFFIAVPLFLAGCEREEIVHPFRTYVIHQGNHYASGHGGEFVQDQTFQFIATFDSSAIYTQQEASPRGVNKLRGFSDCGSAHHENSARFGWEWIDSQLLIYAYTYANSVRAYEVMGAVPLNRDVTYTIESVDGEYIFTYRSAGEIKVQRMKRGCSGKGGVRYLLYPYFGGEAVAPHDIRFKVMD